MARQRTTDDGVRFLVNKLGRAMDTPQKLLTVDQVASLLACKPDKVRSLIRAGRLRAIDVATSPKPGKRCFYRVAQSAVDQFLAESEVQPVTELLVNVPRPRNLVRSRKIAWRKRNR